MNALTEIFFCFGTVNIIQFPLVPDRLPTEEACRQTAGTIRILCERYDRMLSVFREDSEISRINAAAGKNPVKVSGECLDFLKEADRMARVTSLSFDPYIRPLSELWDEAFLEGKESFSVPEEIRAKRAALCRRTRPEISGNLVMLPEEGMGVDPGGIAKGFVLDRIAELPVTIPDGTVISLGGSVAAYGRCTVPVRDPFRPDGPPMAELLLENKKAVTSGVCERFFSEEGIGESHILDAETGWPADPEIICATLVGDKGAELDALATAAVLRGPGAFKEYFNKNGIGYLYVKRSGEIRCSKDLKEAVNVRSIPRQH